jgi:hypothetical protein
MTLDLLRAELVEGYFIRDHALYFLKRNREQIAALSPADRRTLIKLHATIMDELKYCSPALFVDPPE